jgi:hypothetical protein
MLALRCNHSPEGRCCAPGRGVGRMVAGRGWEGRSVALSAFWRHYHKWSLVPCTPLVAGGSAGPERLDPSIGSPSASGATGPGRRFGF